MFVYALRGMAHDTNFGETNVSLLFYPPPHPFKKKSTLKGKNSLPGEQILSF